MAKGYFLALFLTVPLAGQDHVHPSADEALRLLKEGNARYVANQLQHPHQTPEWRVRISTEQHPFAQVLACSDSRVAPEILFDEGLGDLFVVRVAGNILDDAVIGTLEYGVEHLHVPLTVVLGHKGCGAVTAAVHRGEVHDHILSLMDFLLPSVRAVQGREGDPVENAVRANVARCVRLLRESEPTLAPMVREGKAKIVGAIYDLKTGKVEWNKFPMTAPMHSQ